MEDILNKIVDDYYSDTPCIDTNYESTETYDNDHEYKKIKEEGWLLFYNMI